MFVFKKGASYVSRLSDFMSHEFEAIELCIAAIKQNGRSLEFVPEEFKTAELCLAVIDQGRCASESAPYGFRGLFSAAEVIAGNKSDVPKVLLTEEPWPLAVEYGTTLMFVPEEFRTAKVYLAAVKSGYLNFRDIPEETVSNHRQRRWLEEAPLKGAIKV